MLSAAGRAPDYLIASDFPLHGGTQQIASAVAFVLRRHGFRAGRYGVGYQSCDASTADSGQSDSGKRASNAKAYVADPAVIGVVGPYNSACAAMEIPILNRAPGAPLAIISPTASFIGLTHLDPSAPRGALQRLYPTGIRNFARVTPADDAEAAAAAVFAHQRGLRRLYVLDDGSDGSREEWALPFRRTARALGMRIVGSASGVRPGSGSRRWSSASGAPAPMACTSAGSWGSTRTADRSAARAARARSHADRPESPWAGQRPLGQLAGRGPRRVHHQPAAAQRTPRPARPEVPSRVRRHPTRDPSLELGRLRRRSDRGATRRHRALRRHPTSVTQQFLSTRRDNGALGPMRFDGNGELTAAAVTIMRVQRRRAGPETGNPFDGATIDRVIARPADPIR